MHDAKQSENKATTGQEFVDVGYQFTQFRGGTDNMFFTSWFHAC